MTQAIFFLTGTSGTGKTTLVKNLKSLLPEQQIYDFDEQGVPTNPDEEWRKEKTAYWLEKAKQNLEQNISTIICGVTVPKEVQNTPAYNPKLQIHYGLVYCSDEQIKNRLEKRNWDPQLISDNINWAHHLHRCVAAEKNNFILDNTNYTPVQTAQKVSNWISSIASTTSTF